MSINLVDLIVIAVLAYFVWQGFLIGLIAGMLNLATTVISFLAASIFYPFAGGILSHEFGIGDNFSFILSFFLILIVSEVVLSFLVGWIYKSLITPLHKRYKAFSRVDQALGVFPSGLVGAILVSLFLILFLVFPINPSLRSMTERSWWGRHVLVRALELEPKVERYLNRLPYKSLIYLLTPDPKSGEVVKLSFPAKLTLKEDPDSEKTLLALVNQERSRRGLDAVKADRKLTEVGRAHCLDMFKRSYLDRKSTR